ncbi:hypothetical protein [Paenibacillus gansuensis]|uniref:Flp pilus-assembly TadG-like N-terminal domain-containing protein n=1 Tax=Paenibacillus gansuensis TaxID=306542 RepID=A0ABW5PHQ4_9BACL
MHKLFHYIKRPIKNQRGMSDMLVLLIILPTFLCITLIIITFVVFLMRQGKLDDVQDRALQMVKAEGVLSQAIIDDTLQKLDALGFSPTVKNGVTYPDFTGSTRNKVLRDDADPTVKVIIKYPASNLQRILAFFGATSTEESGYFKLEGYGRSEAYE